MRSFAIHLRVIPLETLKKFILDMSFKKYKFKITIASLHSIICSLCQRTEKYLYLLHMLSHIMMTWSFHGVVFFCIHYLITTWYVSRVENWSYEFEIFEFGKCSKIKSMVSFDIGTFYSRFAIAVAADGPAPNGAGHNDATIFSLVFLRQLNILNTFSLIRWHVVNWRDLATSIGTSCVKTKLPWRWM